MTTEDIKNLLPENFASTSKVWVYQSNRLFSLQEAFDLEHIFNEFVKNWQSHGAPVKGYVNLFFGRFIVLMADETQCKVGGCSTDSSARMIKQIEQTFKVNLFDRLQLAFFIKDKVEVLPMSQVAYGFTNNFLTPETLYFNNLVATKAELENNWITPIKNTWLYNKFCVQL